MGTRHTQFFMDKEYPNIPMGGGSGGGISINLVYELTIGSAWETFANPNSDNPLMVEAYNGGLIGRWFVEPNGLPAREGGDYYLTIGNIPTTGIPINMGQTNSGGTIYISTNGAFPTNDTYVRVYTVEYSSGGGGGSSSGINYSTDEQEIGTWINGEKLYRKVIHYTTTLPNNTWTTIVSLTNCVIKKFSGLAYWSADYTDALAIDYANPSESQYIATSIHNGGSSFSVRPQLSATIYGCDVILEYIKTS